MSQHKMGNNTSRQEYFEQYGIDPYEVLSITPEDKLDTKQLRRAYKKKALLLHPDKSKSDSSKLEFQILTECYEYLVENLELQQTTIKEQQNDFAALKRSATLEQHKGSTSIDRPVSTRSQIDHNAFEKSRGKYLIDDLDFEAFDKKVSNRDAADKRKKEEDVYRSFKDKKFNIDKFNALFDYRKIPVTKDLVKFNPEPSLAFGTIAMTKVVHHNGILIATESENDVSVKSLKDIQNEAVDNPNKDVDDILTAKLVNKLTKTRKENTQKISRKKATALMNEKNAQKFSVNTSMSFEEAALDIQAKKITELRREMAQNEKDVQRFGHIFGQKMLKEASNGLLDDSSMCLRDNRLSQPTGTRKLRQ